MSKLNNIFEVLQNRIDAGEITLETANSVLEKAKAKYEGEEVGVLKEAAPLTLDDALNTINTLLSEAEELHKDQGTETTSKDAPDLPEKTSTGEGVTDKIDANDTTSTKKMEDLADKNDENAKADAQGEEDRDTTVSADPVTESVNSLKLRVYEAADAGYITADEKSLFLEYLNLDNYVLEKDDEEEEDEEEDKKDDKDSDDEDDEKKSDKKKKKKDDDEECDHEDKDGDGECDKCGADMDDVEESEKVYTNKILNAYTEGVISEDQVISLLSK